jgi:hypothetical protein
VCGSDAILEGDTEYDVVDDNGDDIPDLLLTFFGNSFYCKDCGLKLEDYDELEIAGIDPIIDRSEEVDEWMDQHGYYEPYDF